MSNKDDQYIVFGYSGHALSLIDSMLSLGLKIKGYVDKNKIDNYYDIKYLGSETDENFNYMSSNYLYVVAVGDNKIRQKISDSIRDLGFHTPNIIDPTAVVASQIEMGSGNFISKNAVVNSYCHIGNNVIINTSSIVEHNSFVHDNVHIAPGAVVCGNVEIRNNSFIGANSVIKNGIKIGKNVTIGAGSVVLNDVKSNSVLFGNPAN
jgi:sugar O-acyltransferase (sialic acid O-acetyltransferase NeuD family)